MIERVPRDAEPEERSWFDAAAERGCVPPELLRPLSAGTLPPEIALRVQTHLSSCAACQALLDALAALDEEGPSTEEEVRIERAVNRARGGRRSWLSAHPSWLAAAAMVVAAAGLTLLLVVGSDPTLPGVRVPPRDRELPGESFALALQKPGVDLPPDALVLRSDGSSPFVAALAPALESWKLGRFGEAATKFRAVTDRFPDRPHGHFYLGVSLLLGGHAAEAVGALQRARALASEDPSLRDSSTWYLAVALERSGQTASAVQELADLCLDGSVRRGEACRGLAAIGTLTPRSIQPPTPDDRGPVVPRRDRPAVGTTRPDAGVPIR